MKKITVNHSGACSGYAYKADEPFEMPEKDVPSFVEALGEENVLVEEVRKEAKKAVKKAPDNEEEGETTAE